MVLCFVIPLLPIRHIESSAPENMLSYLRGSGITAIYTTLSHTSGTFKLPTFTPAPAITSLKSARNTTSSITSRSTGLSASDAPPKLNKAFVVSPGNALISTKLKAKITGAHFVYMVDMLSVNLQVMEQEPQTNLHGKSSTINGNVVLSSQLAYCLVSVIHTDIYVPVPSFFPVCSLESGPSQALQLNHFRVGLHNHPIKNQLPTWFLVYRMASVWMWWVPTYKQKFLLAESLVPSAPLLYLAFISASLESSQRATNPGGKW